MKSSKVACLVTVLSLANACSGPAVEPAQPPVLPPTTTVPAPAVTVPPPPVVAAPPAAPAAFPVIDALAPDTENAQWGVYVMVGEPETPALQAEFTRLAESGAQASLGELDCDQGARQGLQASETAHAVSVHFPTREAAEAFARALPVAPAGIVRVVVGCAD